MRTGWLLGMLALAVASGCGTGSARPSSAAGPPDGGSDSSSGTSASGTGKSSSNASADGGADDGTASAVDAASAERDTGTDARADAETDAAIDGGIPVGDGSSMEAATCRTSSDGVTNCTSSFEVEGGVYDRTYTNGGTAATALADPATVSGFRMDEYLVTVGRFRQYVSYVTADGGAPPDNGSGIHTHLNGGFGLANSGNPGTYETGWDATDWNTYIATGPDAASTWNTNLSSCSPGTWTAVSGSQENLPVNCVNWYESYAFCIWDGGFLPSEAEWEYVAAGGSRQLEYPWGSVPPGTGSLYAIYACDYPDASGICTGVGNIAPVGTTILGSAIWGQFDMAGDVFEWNLDWLDNYVDPCMDCTNLIASFSGRVIRGGDYDVGGLADLLLPPYRGASPPLARGDYLGVRCARTP
jgi:formylglycine-generating enzyme required for sulfatase activity